MRFTIICLMTLLLVPAFGAQSKGKERDQTTSPPPAHLPPPQAHLPPPPSRLHPPPVPRPGIRTYPPKQPLPPPRQPVDLSKVNTRGQFVHFQVHPSFSNEKSGVILDSAPDKHDLYNIAPAKSRTDFTGNVKGWRVNHNQIVKVHKDDITKTTKTNMPQIAGIILDHQAKHPPEVIHTRLSNLPAISSTSYDQPGTSKSTGWGISDKFGKTGGRRRR